MTRFKERGVIVLVGGVAAVILASRLSGWPSAVVGVPGAFAVLCGLMMIFIDPDKRY